MIKFVKDAKKGCEYCCLNSNKEMCSHVLCAGGYFVNVKRTRPRKSYDRVLLEALLSGNFEKTDTGVFISVKCFHLTRSQVKQLTAINESVKGGGK